HHNCIAFRQPSTSGIYAWEFEKAGREMRVRVDGELVFNRMSPMLNAARAGFGLACLLEDTVEADVAAGRLIRVLADWFRHSTDTTSTTRLADSARPRSSCLSTRCASKASR